MASDLWHGHRSHLWLYRLRLQCIDDGRFPAVVEPYTQNLSLLLPPSEPVCEFVKQTHLFGVT